MWQASLRGQLAGADTLLAFPAILTLHTVGLGIVVGTNLLVDFKLLGAAPDVSLSVVTVPRTRP